jgi:2,3-bisphosphoglycerate-dependent phosphoglycerate mutase
MHLLLIRHGESVNNALYTDTHDWSARVADPELTPRGQEQAARLADRFADGTLPHPHILLTSLMRRAVQTAAPLAEALDLPLQGDLLLHEVHGMYESTEDSPHPHAGSPASVLQACSPRLILPSDVGDDGWYHRPFETPAIAWKRARLVINQLTARYGETDHLVAAVTHSWFMQYLMRAVIGWPAPDDGNLTSYFMLNTTASVFLSFPGLNSPTEIRWVNRTDHLTDDLLTW